MIKTGKISQEKPLPIVFTSMLFRNLPNLPEMDVVYSQSQTSQVPFYLCMEHIMQHGVGKNISYLFFMLMDIMFML